MRAPDVEDFRPLGLDVVMAAAALHERADVKYVVSRALLASLVELLRPTHGVLEIDGVRAFTYRTTYFDTCGLLTYREHVQRRRRRFKCRVREYADSGMRQFEVKLKGMRDRTVKHRLPLEGADAAGLDAPALTFLADRLREGYGRALSDDLGPTLAMRYRRITFAVPERAERLTCDFDLHFVTPDGRTGKLAPDHVILESKTLSGAGLADRELRRLGSRPVTGCSKYCLGIGFTHPNLSSGAFRPLLRRYFEVGDPQ